ncbi:extensin family protein [Phenylobacterium immobile]|uniref:extensin family protein n=1 Tax=Phenylobacterium immobile TaxID=21 RepID=UPI000A4CF7F5|nr:extensin family protein [Phenylobacterium immobile]
MADMGLDRRPVFLSQPIDASTRGRLAYATRTPDDCAQWMAAQGLDFRPVADQTQGEYCVVTGAGTLRDAAEQPDARLSPARPMMACPLAAALALWRRQSVDPAAREILGSPVRQIDHLGVYACRTVGRVARPSAHAHAAAIDIAGFRLVDGRRVTVERDWASDPAKQAFLRRVHDEACVLFGTVLSPDYNADHANHLHFEGTRYGLCR